MTDDFGRATLGVVSDARGAYVVGGDGVEVEYRSSGEGERDAGVIATSVHVEETRYEALGLKGRQVS